MGLFDDGGDFATDGIASGRMMMRGALRYTTWVALLLGSAAVLVSSVGAQLSDTFTNWVDHPAIESSVRPSHDKVDELIRAVETRRVRLPSATPAGYLRSLLEALNVPVESQIAVFAKDSFQDPCSYMIYSPAFDGLPLDAKEAVYRRMWSVLSGEATGAKYARLSLGDRQAVVEILRETKSDLPDYFGMIK